MKQTKGDETGDVQLEQLKTDKQNGVDTSVSEQVSLVQKKRRVSIKTACKLRKVTLIVSWVSVVYLGIMGMITFVLAILKGNSSSFAFALDALLDCVSSVVVIWRYSGAAVTLYSAQRERRACITLGALFILSFASIVTRSSVSIATRTHPMRSTALWALSILNTIVCAGFLIVKAFLARKLESISLATDAVNSGIGLMISFSAVISDWLYNMQHSVWYVDPTIGIICSIFLLSYGIWIIVYEVKFTKHSDVEEELTGDMS